MSGIATAARQKNSATRICFVSGVSSSLQSETSRSGIAISWRIASERKPLCVPPPRTRLATITMTQRANIKMGLPQSKTDGKPHRSGFCPLYVRMLSGMDFTILFTFVVVMEQERHRNKRRGQEPPGESPLADWPMLFSIANLDHPIASFDSIDPTRKNLYVAIRVDNPPMAVSTRHD